MAQMDRQKQAEQAAAAESKAGFGYQTSLNQGGYAADLAKQKESEQAQAALAESGYAAQSGQLNQKAQLQAAAEARRQAQLNGLMASLAMTGGGGSNPNIGITSQEQAAEAAAFNRAKDTAGQVGRSAITGLQEATAGRGFGAESGLATGQIADVIHQGAQGLTDVSREQAIQEAGLARQRASEAIQASLARRGQNMSLINSALSGLNGAAY